MCLSHDPVEPENASFLEKLLHTPISVSCKTALSENKEQFYKYIYEHCCLELNPVCSAKPI